MVKINDDENGPIEKLNKKIIAVIGDSFTVRYNSGDIKDHISTTIDSLDSDYRLHMGIITAGSSYVCLAQKYGEQKYASGLVFSYATNNKLFIQIKINGTWQAVREI
jgi:hypothetical protein